MRVPEPAKPLIWSPTEERVGVLNDVVESSNPSPGVTESPRAGRYN